MGDASKISKGRPQNGHMMRGFPGSGVRVSISPSLVHSVQPMQGPFEGTTPADGASAGCPGTAWRVLEHRQQTSATADPGAGGGIAARQPGTQSIVCDML